MGTATVGNDFFMDICLSGAQDEENARRLCYEMDELLRGCGFTLQVVPNANDDILELSDLHDTTVLGLRWPPKTDDLIFKCKQQPPLERGQATKRCVLSRIAQIFDPNGYIGPVVIVAKILMLKIWFEKIRRDELVPIEIFYLWQQFQKYLLRSWLMEQFSMQELKQASKCCAA